MGLQFQLKTHRRDPSKEVENLFLFPTLGLASNFGPSEIYYSLLGKCGFSDLQAVL